MMNFLLATRTVRLDNPYMGWFDGMKISRSLVARLSLLRVGYEREFSAGL